MIYKSITINNHQDYLDLLSSLKNRIEYLEIIINDEEDTRFIEKFPDNIISIKDVNTWWNFNNKEIYPTKLYRFQMSDNIYQYLQTFDTLCYTYEPGVENEFNFSDFGKNDIAFLDKNANVILRTDIKNGYIDIEYKKESGLCN